MISRSPDSGFGLAGVVWPRTSSSVFVSDRVRDFCWRFAARGHQARQIGFDTGLHSCSLPGGVHAECTTAILVTYTCLAVGAWPLKRLQRLHEDVYAIREVTVARGLVISYLHFSTNRLTRRGRVTGLMSLCEYLLCII